MRAINFECKLNVKETLREYCLCPLFGIWITERECISCLCNNSRNHDTCRVYNLPLNGNHAYPKRTSHIIGVEMWK